MDYLILMGIIVVFIALLKQRGLTLGCVVEVREQLTEAQLILAVEQAKAAAFEDIEQVKQEARNDVLNHVDRIYSEAELAAKSFGYWEKQVYVADSDPQRSFCYKNARNAQILLMRAAGDFVPDLAKCAIEITVKGKLDREHREKAAVIPLYPSSG